MKFSTIASAAAVCLAVACSQKSCETWQQAMSGLEAYAEEAGSDSLYFTRCDAVYREHLDDSAGLMLFKTLATNWWEPEAALEEYEKASEMIRQDELIDAKMQALRNTDKSAPGNPYIEVEGTDILTGEPLGITSMLALGKPVIVDFWASWCPPCKREIREGLVPLAKTGEYSILGVAVWEDSPEDTKGMMKTLGVSWPVIYTGGRVGSPSIDYGVVGIPTLVLISTDGKIVAKAHTLEDILRQQ